LEALIIPDFTPDHDESFMVVRKAIGMSDTRLLVPEGDLRPIVLPGDLSAISDLLGRWQALGLTVRVVRGRKSRLLTGMFDEFASALQFPLYFGYNRDAFDECIADLDWLSRAKGIVIVVTEPDEVLADADPSDLDWFARSLGDAARTFSEPIDSGEWWDRPAVPFHIVFVGEPPVVERAQMRWPQ